MRMSDYQCDHCGKHKSQDANHWLLGVVATRRQGEVVVHCGVTVKPWDDRLANRKEVVHFCGDQCATLWQARQMSRPKQPQSNSNGSQPVGAGDGRPTEVALVAPGN